MLHAVQLRGNAVSSERRVVETAGNFVAAVNRVVDATGIKHEALAAQVEMSAGYFSKILAATQGALDVIDKLPEDVQRRIAREWCESLGYAVSEPSPAQLNAEVLQAVDALVALVKRARLAEVRRAAPARASLSTAAPDRAER